VSVVEVRVTVDVGVLVYSVVEVLAVSVVKVVVEVPVALDSGKTAPNSAVMVLVEVSVALDFVRISKTSSVLLRRATG